ncbi:rab-GTPase-TBC domain-containing protein, partial [Cunninghamella echinulata]
RHSWDIIFNDANLSEASLRQRAIANVDVSTWPSIQIDERNKYTELRKKHIEELAELVSKKNDNLTDNNPLALSESNPWQKYFADSEIRKVIRQDVDRTFPDIEFFRDEKVQEKMTDILFIYCKIHHDVSYRQGMHELLAPFYWIIATESLEGVPEEDLNQFKSPDSTNEIMAQVLDPQYIEHDAYLLFDKLMTYAKPWYEYNNTVQSDSNKKTAHRLSKSSSEVIGNTPQIPANLNPVVGVCQRIHYQLLHTADPPLYKHLESFGIEPQLYGIRWLRLLFGREFEFHELLKLWDGIFAQDPTLKIVEYVCLVILLRLHDQLIEGDYADCLSLLMRGTQIIKPITLVEQATYLQGNLSYDGALQILRQNDIRLGKEPRESLWKNDENTTLENQHHRYQQQQRDPSLSYQQRSPNPNFNGLSNLTRGVMKSPQVRDLNKAIAGVMGTVQKNVNIFGDNVLGRSSDGQYQRRRVTVSSSEFPESIDRIASPQYHSKTTLPKSSSNNSIHQSLSTKDDSTTLKTMIKMNRQMGDLMAKCIDVLEKELFSQKISSSSSSPYSSPTMKNDTATTSDTQHNECENMNNIEHLETTTPIETDSPSLTSIDINSSFATTNEDDNIKDESNLSNGEKSGIDEASIILTLAGLKHVRDVLQGKQMQFDSNILDFQSMEKQPSTTVNINNIDDSNKSSDSDWTIVDTISKKPLPNIQQPSSLQQNQQQNQQSKSNITHSSLPQTVSPSPPLSTYVSSHPPVPKQQITYSIDDLLSDPEYQPKNNEKNVKSIHPNVDNKFKWMMDSDHKDNNETINVADTIKSTNVLPTSTSSSLGSSHALFDDIPNTSVVPTGQHLRQTNRKRSSFILNKNTQQNNNGNNSTASSPPASQIDPLDAKNVDKRYFYEYDMYH